MSSFQVLIDKVYLEKKCIEKISKNRILSFIYFWYLVVVFFMMFYSIILYCCKNLR